MILSPLALHGIVSWCRQGVPLEACGLFGAVTGHEEQITHLWPCANAAQSTHHFRVAQTDLERIVAEAARHCLTIVGGWHSHLSAAAVPSKADLAMAPYPEWVSIIVSLATVVPEVRAWQGGVEVTMITRG